MSLVEAQSIDTAKALAVEAIKHKMLSAVRLWDGDRLIEVHRPTRPAPAKERDEVNDRGAQMIAMKAEGKTQRQIAAFYGISVDRVRQLMARTQSRARMHATQPNRAALSVRAENVLRALIVDPETDPSVRDRLLPARVAALDRRLILDANNAGKTTLSEIEAWLWERGLCLTGKG